MSLLEYLGFKPTLPRFARRVLAAIPGDERRHWTWNEERGALVRDGLEISLHNMFLEYCRNPVSGRAELVRKYGALAQAQSQEVPALWVAASRHVFPVLRSEFVESALQIQTRGEASPGWNSVVLPFAGDMRIRLAYDFGDYVSLLKSDHLEQWGQTAADVLPHAIANLGRLAEPTWVEVADGVFRVDSPESYGESLLLLPSVVAKLPFAAHAVLSPCNRGILLAADGRDDAAVAALVGEMLRCLQEEPWAMTATLFVRDGDAWRESAPPAVAAEMAHAAQALNRAEFYATQKQALDAHHEKHDIDVYVADYTLVQNGRALESYCVWGEGVVALLPVTDWVAVLPAGERDAGGKAAFIRVPWAALQSTCGARMQATGENPPRFRVDDFPTAGEQAELRAAALP